MPTLPIELIILILENTYYKYSGEDLEVRDFPDYQTLSACTRVCSSWTPLAQRLLFRHVTFDRFLYFGPHPRSRIYSHIRVLEVSLEPIDDVHVDQVMDTFLDVLCRCSRLYELKLFLISGHSLNSDAISRIRGSGLTNLRSLRILQCSVQSPILYQLLELFPTVRFLTVGVEIVATPPASRIPDLQLYELVLHRTLPPEVLKWLLPSEATLEILELRDPPSSQTIQILQSHAPGIRSLRLLRYDAKIIELIRLCTHLEELIMPQISTLVHLSALPPSLEHFSFFVNPNNSFADVNLAIKDLSNLRLVTCNEPEAPDSEFASFSATCQKLGIFIRPPLKLWPVSGCPFRKYGSLTQLFTARRPYLHSEVSSEKVGIEFASHGLSFVNGVACRT